VSPAPSIPFVDLHPGADEDDVREAVARVVRSGWYVLGPEVEAFEREFAGASGAPHAVGVANGTDAIALLLRAAGVGPGDEVVVPALTAPFTALAVTAIGARPVFADVDPRRLTLDPAACEAALTPRTRAIVPVHLYGQPADVPALEALAARRGVALVEDCCQAHMATCAGVPVGTRGVGGAFSFYPTKNLGALGDGGAIVTCDAAVAETVRRLRNGGRADRDRHVLPGVNSRLDEMQAAVLRTRLTDLAAATERRRSLARMYREALDGIITMLAERDAGHVYHLFPVRSAARDELRAHLAAAGIETLVHYPRSLHEQPVFAGFRHDGCGVATVAAADLLSLPLHPRLSDADARVVIEAVSGLQRDRGGV
jgi:dTDP-4-amino-4,6-dideoxygalactose transaminase